jgi:hypothetical protein
MLDNKDKLNYEELVQSLRKTDLKLVLEENTRDTETLYRFGWFHINDYKYSVSGWSFRKKIVTFEDVLGDKIKFSIPDNKIIGTNFKKDNFITYLIKKIRNSLANYLKDISDKLRT